MSTTAHGTEDEMPNQFVRVTGAENAALHR